MATSPPLASVLITGGCGFIGHHVIQHIFAIEPKCRIHVLDINTSRNRVENAVYHEGDIASASTVDKALRDALPAVIIHIACPDSMIINEKLNEQVNVFGTRNLLSSAKAIGTVKAFVFTSTSSVIHDNLTDLLDADESLPVLRPPAQTRVYTLTKATAEEEILSANRASGDHSMLTCSLRPCTAIGEADTICLGKILSVAAQGKARLQMGSGQNVYDFVYVGNLADAHILAARRLLAAYGRPQPPLDSRVDGECFNITNDERVLFWDFQRRIAAAGGFPVKEEEIKVVPVWLGLMIGWISEWLTWARSRGTRQSNMTMEGIRLSTINRTLSVEKAKRVLGYKPAIKLDEGIQRGADWWVANHGKPQS